MKKAKSTQRNVRSASLRSADVSPVEVRIRQRAYEIHQAHGGHHGRDLDDWLQAEREIKAEMEIRSEGNPAGPESLSSP